MRVSKYIVVREVGHHTLRYYVEESIREGFVPQGGVSQGGKYLLQAMVKYTDEEVPAIDTTL